jgi:hypothetical protein
VFVIEFGNDILEIKIPLFLQEHCQSPTSHRLIQSFVKELESQPNEEKKFLKMPHRTGKEK